MVPRVRPDAHPPRAVTPRSSWWTSSPSTTRARRRRRRASGGWAAVRRVGEGGPAVRRGWEAKVFARDSKGGGGSGSSFGGVAGLLSSPFRSQSGRSLLAREAHEAEAEARRRGETIKEEKSSDRRLKPHPIRQFFLPLPALVPPGPARLQDEHGSFAHFSEQRVGVWVHLLEDGSDAVVDPGPARPAPGVRHQRGDGGADEDHLRVHEREGGGGSRARVGVVRRRALPPREARRRAPRGRLLPPSRSAPWSTR